MPLSPYAQAKLNSYGGSGFSSAKKLADLAIKTNVDAKGNTTETGYQQAIQILQPYISSSGTEGIDAQRLIAGYNNSMAKTSVKQRDANQTVAAFKIQEANSYFTSAEGEVVNFRDPASLVVAVSPHLDGLVASVLTAINEKESLGEDVSALYGYLDDLTKRADAMRKLSNDYMTGELKSGEEMNGFGYYVNTDPVDGSVKGAAILPVDMLPDGVGTGYKRLDTTVSIDGNKIPMYAPAQQDATGEYVARIGNQTWTGTGSAALNAKDGKGFDLKDATTFPVKKTAPSTGSFVRSFSSYDEKGNATYKYLYKGQDGNLYNVDQTTLESFKSDPLLKQKVDGFVETISPTEMQELTSYAVPFDNAKVAQESKITGYRAEAEIAQRKAEEINNLGFFGKLKLGMKEAANKNPIPAPSPEPSTTPAPQPGSSFFQNRNQPNKPNEPTSVGGSTPDVIEQGKSFFRNTFNFLKR